MRDMRMTLPRRISRAAGFTLLELLIAALIFTTITGAAFSLVAKHQPIFKQQQNQSALNIGMRNAIAQLQEDIVNGGSGYYTGINVPNWPVSAVLTNNVVTSAQDCHSGTTYSSTCFDALTVITVDPLTIPVNVLADASGTLPVTAGTCTASTVNTNSSTQIFVLPPAGVTAATYKGNFGNGDHLMVVKNDASKYTVVTLSANGTTQVVGGVTYVVLTHAATNPDGSNSATNDPTYMTVNPSGLLNTQYCATDWIARLTPIRYDVDTTTDSTNPTLRRTLLTGTTTPANGGVALVNQTIGFKVGASLVTDPTGTYNFDSSTFGAGYDYTAVRSVMVSLIGRTAPNSPDLDPTFRFVNSFDGGHYQIQGVSVVVNPRNTMF